MYARVDRLGPHRGNVEVEHLRLQVVDNDLALLPVSVLAIYEDFLTACEHFAGLLEAEAAAGGSELLTRWWQNWNALGSPEETRSPGRPAKPTSSLLISAWATEQPRSVVLARRLPLSDTGSDAVAGVAAAFVLAGLQGSG